MAKIKNDDIFVPGVISKTTEEAKLLLKTLDELEKGFIDVAKAQQKILNKEDNSTIQSVQKTTAAIKELSEVEKASLKVQQQKKNLSVQLRIANSEANKQNVQTKLQLQEQTRAVRELEKAKLKSLGVIKKTTAEINKETKAAQQQRKTTVDSANAFKRLEKQVNNAQARFKRLAAQHGVNSKQAQKANIAFAQLDDRLRRINKTARDGRRDVGRYGLAFREVGVSMKSLFLAGGVVGVIRGVGLAFSDAFGRMREFDKEMQNLSGISGIARKELGGLEKIIISVAGGSIKTSNEVAKLATTLFALGKTRPEVERLLKPVNNLSIALNATSEEAGELLVSTLNAFQKGAESGQHFADVIAKMRTSTSLDFERIKDSLGFVSATANVLNLTIGETGALIGVLQDNNFKAARAGRLLNSSFIKLAKEGKTLEGSLDRINKAQERGAKSSEILRIAEKDFGLQSASLGVILASNRDSIAELANEFDNLSQGALKELTDTQLDSLDAKFKILDSTYERFIISIENGTGVFSKFIKSSLTGLTQLITGLRRLNQTRKEGVEEDVEITNRDFIEDLEDDFNKRFVLRSKDLLDQKKTAKEIALIRQEERQSEINKRIAIRESRVEEILDNTKFKDLTLETAAEIAAANKKTLDERVFGIELVSKISGKNSNKQKREAAIALLIIQDEIDQLKLLTRVIDEEREAEEENIIVKGKKNKVVRELTGLIELQAKAVSDLNAEIRRAKDEDLILSLSLDLDKEKEELDRLKRIVTSSLEEIQKIELDLIEDTTDKRVAKEKEKSDKLIKQIRTNSRVEEDVKNELIVAETERFENFELNEAIKKRKRIIKQEADFARAEIEQRRTGFKTQEEFEKFKAEQFEAIKRNQLQAELDLLIFSDRDQDKLRREQLKAQLEGLNDLGEGFEKLKGVIGDIVQVIGDLIDEAFDRRIAAIGEQLDKTGANIDRLRDKAQEGQLESEESLAFEQKQEIELARQREREQKRQERTQAFFAILSSFNANDGNLSKTIADISVLKALASGFTAFDGVDDTGGRGNIDSKGGRTWTLHPHEQVHSLQDRKDMRDPNTGRLRSRDELKNIVGAYDNGFMMDVLNSGSNELMNNSSFVLNGMNTGKIESGLEKLSKDIRGIVIPENHFDYDMMRNIFKHHQKKGNTIKTTESKLF